MGITGIGSPCDAVVVVFTIATPKRPRYYIYMVNRTHMQFDGVTVYYPYEDAEVRLRFNQGNEAARLARESD